jgi:hypothetical protein
VRDRLDEMPTLSVGEYLRYLVRLGPLPSASDGPPAPTPRENGERETELAPVPEPMAEDRDWWERP